MILKPTKKLQIRRIKRAEEACREQKLIGLKTFGFLYFKNYVKNMMRWSILERRYINE